MIVNGDDLDKMKEKDLSKNSFREKVLDKLASSSIPDANAIHAARKKREEARRQATMGESYVPLNGQKSKMGNNIPGRRIDGTESDPDEEIIKMEINKKKIINDDIDEGREKDDEGVRRYKNKKFQKQFMKISKKFRTKNINLRQKLMRQKLFYAKYVFLNAQMFCQSFAFFQKYKYTFLGGKQTLFVVRLCTDKIWRT